MFSIVDKLPDGVEVCDFYKRKVARRKEGKRKFKYICIMQLGRAYYIPITPAIWRAFGLKDKLRNQDGDYTWGMGDVDEALSEVIGSVMSQVRASLLDGVEQSVMQEIKDRIEAVMHGPLREELERRVDGKAGMLPPASLCKFGSEVEKQCTPMRGANDCGEYHRCPKWAKDREDVKG